VVDVKDEKLFVCNEKIYKPRTQKEKSSVNVWMAICGVARDGNFMSSYFTSGRSFFLQAYLDRN